jgi:anaerobic magnesium-protoporphyrin IX monomethyl ester cyclase
LTAGKESNLMNILALNPPFLPKYSRESRSPAVTKSGTLYYPMWLAYAVASCEKKGHSVLFIDAPAAKQDLAEVIKRARAASPRMAILDTSTPSIYNDAQVAAELKKAIPGLFVIMVGVHVSAVPEQTLLESPAVDAVAVREYDETVAELAGVVEQGVTETALAGIAGMAFRKKDGSIAKNELRPHITNLDDIPFVSNVYKRHLDLSPYFYGHSRYPLIVIITGRGCPFKCTYCVIPQTLQGHAYRKRSVENVVAEMKSINENFPQVKEIMIEDDTFTADKARCRAICEGLVREKATKIPWSANSRCDVDYETLRIMKKANCRLLCVGVESGEQRILDNIQKNMTVEKIRAFVKDARRARVLVHGCFMVGNRGETRETLQKTLQFSKEISPDTAQFFPIMVYPGTADYAWFDEKGWITSKNYRHWITDEGLHSSVVSNPDLTYGELVAFCDRARREFYLRPSYIAAKALQAIRTPGEAKRLLKGFSTLWRYLLRPARTTG